MKIDLNRINPMAILVALVSTVACVFALVITIVLNNQTTTIQAASAATITETQETERWQHDAPAVIAAIQQSGRRISSICQNTLDTNSLMLRIVQLVNQPSRHVTATLDDLIAIYPTPTPAPTASAQTLSTTPQNTVPLAVPTFQAGPGAGLNHVGVMNADLVAFRRQLTVNGNYPDVVASVANLAHASIPVTIDPPSLDRLGDSRVTLKTTLTVLVPPPNVCALALARSDAPLIAPDATRPTPAASPSPNGVHP